MASVDEDRQTALRSSAQLLPHWLCIGAILGVLGVALALMWFAQPMADDFARGYDERPPLFSATVREYKTWTGRWAGVAANYVVTSGDLTHAYPRLLLINSVVVALATLAIVFAAGVASNIWQLVALAGGALAIYWAGMPHPGESVYWLTGSTDNLVGPSLAVLLLAALLQHRPRPGPAAFVSGVGLVLLALVVAGFHEVYALMLCLALAGGTLCMWIGRDRRVWFWGACLVAAITGFFIVYLAPGNDVRRSQFPQAGSLATTFALAAKHGMPTVAAWVLDVRLLTATALLLMLQRLPPPGHGASAGGRTILPIVAVTAAAAVGLALLAGYWAIGIELPKRTLGGIYMGFLVGWFSVVVTALKHPARPKAALLVATPWLGRTLAILFASAMMLTGNTWIGLLDLPRSAPAYRREMHDRWALLQEAASSGAVDVEVPRLGARPDTFIGADYFELRRDPEHWENYSVARYFHLGSVRLAAPVSGEINEGQGR